MTPGSLTLPVGSVGVTDKEATQTQPALGL